MDRRSFVSRLGLASAGLLIGGCGKVKESSQVGQLLNVYANCDHIGEVIKDPVLKREFLYEIRQYIQVKRNEPRELKLDEDIDGFDTYDKRLKGKAEIAEAERSISEYEADPRTKRRYYKQYEEETTDKDGNVTTETKTYKLGLRVVISERYGGVGIISNKLESIFDNIDQFIESKTKFSEEFCRRAYNNANGDTVTNLIQNYLEFEGYGESLNKSFAANR